MALRYVYVLSRKFKIARKNGSSGLNLTLCVVGVCVCALLLLHCRRGGEGGTAMRGGRGRGKNRCGTRESVKNP